MPFKVIHQAPMTIAFHRNTIVQAALNALQSPADEFYTAGIIGRGNAVFSDDQIAPKILMHLADGMPVIEKDYSIYSGDSSGFEFVCNSKYWIMRALSTYTNARDDSIDVVAEAYKSIVDNYRGIYKDDDVRFYQKCELYYFFDHIQLLFNYRWFSNPAKLMNAIYDRLLPLLSNSYQFLHQKAKGKLVIAQVQRKNRRVYDAPKTLREALMNITRAIKLAEKVPDAKTSMKHCFTCNIQKAEF